MELQLYNVSPRIPEELSFLEVLANNIWWCWHQNAIELFVRIDPAAWRKQKGTAKAFLRNVPQSRMEELANDAGYLRQLAIVQAEYEKEMSDHLDIAKRQVAYFSLEFGIHESIRS